MEVMGEEPIEMQQNLENYIDEINDVAFSQKMDLPHDLIVYDIATRLPIKSILQYKSISKQWYSSISCSIFGNAYFKLSSFKHPFSLVNCVLICSGNNYFLYSFDDDDDDDDDKGELLGTNSEKGLFRLSINFDGLSSKDEIILVGTCNGLVCLYSIMGYLIIWNPIIYQWTKFSYPLLESFRNFTWGFGYVHSSDDYKVVRICEAKEGRVIVAHVFSLRSQQWKQIHDERLHVYSLHGMPSLAGVLVNETLYWIMYEQGRGEKQCILGYDLVHERFDEIRGLIPGDSYLSGFRFLGCMGGSLAMGRFTGSGDISISILKENGQIEYIGLYRDMDLSSCCDVAGLTKAGKFFIQLGDRELGLVDPNSSPKKYTRLVTFGEQGSTRVLSYTPSLISPLAVAETPKE